MGEQSGTGFGRITCFDKYSQNDFRKGSAFIRVSFCELCGGLGFWLPTILQKFTMYVSVISTISVRLFLSWLFGVVLQLGVIDIALAMVCDWVIRAVLFIWRVKTGRWKTFQVI